MNDLKMILQFVDWLTNGLTDIHQELLSRYRDWKDKNLFNYIDRRHKCLDFYQMSYSIWETKYWLFSLMKIFISIISNLKLKIWDMSVMIHSLAYAWFLYHFPCDLTVFDSQYIINFAVQIHSFLIELMKYQISTEKIKVKSSSNH